MFGFDLNEGPDTKMDRRIVREFDRDVSPITLIGDGDFRHDLSNHFGILMDAVGQWLFSFPLGLWSNAEPLHLGNARCPEVFVQSADTAPQNISDEKDSFPAGILRTYYLDHQGGADYGFLFHKLLRTRSMAKAIASLASCWSFSSATRARWRRLLQMFVSIGAVAIIATPARVTAIAWIILIASFLCLGLGRRRFCAYVASITTNSFGFAKQQSFSTANRMGVVHEAQASTKKFPDSAS
jgi:hypothetical protein